MSSDLRADSGDACETSRAGVEPARAEADPEIEALFESDAFSPLPG